MPTAGRFLSTLLLKTFLPTRWRQCPICGRVARRFHASGKPSRENAKCPECKALERQRAIWLWLQQHPPTGVMLHFAPETCLQDRLREQLGRGYVSLDIISERAMVRGDITRLPFADGTFGFILCSHVLEHIPDDAKAIAELRRVLKPGGQALVLVPVYMDRPTDEDPAVTDPAERMRRFGQEDHVRVYGTDFVQRLERGGFQVQTLDLAALAGPRAIKRHALDSREIAFLCRHAD